MSKKCCQGIGSTSPTKVSLLIEKPKLKKIGTHIEKTAWVFPCFLNPRKYPFDLNNKGQATPQLIAQSLSKLRDIPTSQATAFYALNPPEMQKAAIGGLIDEIIVHPTAALEIQCSFSNWVSTDSTTAYQTPV